MNAIRFYTRCHGLQSFFSIVDTRRANSHGKIIVATLEYDPMRSWASPGGFGLANWQECVNRRDARTYVHILGMGSSFATMGPDVLEIGDSRSWPEPPDYLRKIDSFSPAVIQQMKHFLETGALVVSPFDAVLETTEDRFTLAYLLEETLLYRGEEVALVGKSVDEV